MMWSLDQDDDDYPRTYPKIVVSLCIFGFD